MEPVPPYDHTPNYLAARDVLFNAQDSTGKWVFHSCEDIACIEWGHISDKIRNRLFAQPEQFANVILGFLKRLQDSLYAIDWALVEKLAQKTFCCLLVKIDLAAAALPGSSITSNVDITRLFQSIENSVSISDVPMCFKAIFAAGVKLGKVHAPLIPNNGSKKQSGAITNTPKQGVQIDLALKKVDLITSPLQPLVISEKILAAPSLDTLNATGSEQANRDPPNLIQLHAPAVKDISVFSVAAANRQLGTGDKVMVLSNEWTRINLQSYIGQVATVLGSVSANGWYKVEFNDGSVRSIRGNSIAGETDCRPENMRMVSSTSSSTHCEQEIRIGSIIVVTKGIMIGQEGTIVSIDNGWLKVETPVGKVTLRAEETKVISNGGERSSPLEAENRYKAHVTGLTAQLYIFGRRIFLGEFSTAIEASRAHDIAYIRCIGPKKIKEKDICHPLVDYALLTESNFFQFDDKLRVELTGTLWRGLKSCCRQEFLGNRQISESLLQQNQQFNTDRSRKGEKSVSKAVICRRNLKIELSESNATVDIAEIEKRRSLGKRSFSDSILSPKNQIASPVARKIEQNDKIPDIAPSNISERPTKRTRLSHPENAGARNSTSNSTRRKSESGAEFAIQGSINGPMRPTRSSSSIQSSSGKRVNRREV